MNITVDAARFDTRHECTWSEQESDLWSRIQQHAFESPADGLDLLRRLMREQRWSRQYALRVLEEYRRFFFLIATQAQSLTPSEAVDQVWHLHLTYSRDYWDVWCKDVLLTKVHHGPTRGGAKQALNFGAQYADTIALYVYYFNDIPDDIWLSSGKRFADAGRWRWIDESKYFVIRRPRIPRLALSLILAGASLMVFTSPVIPSTAFTSPANPLNWPAKPFLIVYAIGIFIFCYALLLRWTERVKISDRARLDTPLTPLETAYLIDNKHRFFHTAIADALQSDVVRFSADESRLVRGDTAPKSHQQAIAFAAEDTGTIAQVMELGKHLFDETRQGLEERGFLYTKDQANRRFTFVLMLVWGWLAFGVMRMAIGISRDEAIGYLMLLVFFQLFISVIFIYRGLPLTENGKWALAVTRKTFKGLTLAPRIDKGELPMAVALIGTSAMTATPYADYFYAQPGGRLDSNGGGGAGGGGGSGCGGGGCGGCGG